MKTKHMLSLLCLALTSISVFADSVFIEPVRGSSTSEADKQSLEELIKIAVPQSGSKYSVTDKAQGADWTLSPALIKLGDSYILSIQKKDKTGRAVFSDKMKSTTMSDMDTVSARLTRGVLLGTKVENTADVTNITQDETTMNSRRYNATRQWMVGIGPGWTSNLRSSGGGFTFLVGYLWGLDPDFSVNLSFLTNSGRKNDDASYTDFSLGGEYYFARTKNSPFVGGRIGYGSARVNKDNCNAFSIGCEQDRASGWSTTAVAGYKFFRTSTVNVAVFGSFSYLFDRTSLGNPALSSLQLAVYF